MRSCFVIMPIGDQRYGDVSISQAELRKRYDDLIAEAIRKADPEMDINRADDVSLPGSITTDILTRLMHSSYVVADITFPNPNVFYELGIRHAISNRTILIREDVSAKPAFDISNLRHIVYANTPTGLKELSSKLKDTIEWMEKNPHQADNHFIELAALTKFRYPSFYESPEERQRRLTLALFKVLFKNPEVLKATTDPGLTQDQKNAKFTELIRDNPDFLPEMLEIMFSGGLSDLGKRD